MMRRELGAMIQTELKDPRIGFASVMRVEVSRDLSVAKVFVSILGSEESAADTLSALKHAVGYLRGEVGRRLKLRHAPELDFRRDESITKSLALHQVMKQLQTGEGDGDVRG
jgi:ribosome-binding factor A